MIKIAINCLIILSVSFAVTNGAPVNEATAAIGSAKDAVQGASQQAVDQAQQGHEAISKHLGNLYTNGQKVIKNAAGELQPDIESLGKDINGLYDKAKKNVIQRIEPLAQTVRPYLKQAESYVEPYVRNAQETVPKLVHDALPALQQVSHQVRPTIDSVREQVRPAIESVRGQISNFFRGSQHFAEQGQAQAPAEQEASAPTQELAQVQTQAQQVVKQVSSPSAQ